MASVTHVYPVAVLWLQGLLCTLPVALAHMAHVSAAWQTQLLLTHSHRLCRGRVGLPSFLLALSWLGRLPASSVGQARALPQRGTPFLWHFPTP